MPFGLPLRTRITVTEVVGAELFGSLFAQSLRGRNQLAAATASNVDVAGLVSSVTTSALEAVEHRAQACLRCSNASPCDCSIFDHVFAGALRLVGALSLNVAGLISP